MNTPMPAGVGAGAGPAPEDVRTACYLWWVALGLGVVRLIASLVTAYSGRHMLARDLYERVRAQDPQFTLAQAELTAIVMFVVAAMFWFVAAALAVLVVFQLGRGKAWARMLLTVGAAVLVVGALGALFGQGSGGHGAAAVLVADGATIVQAVLVGGAVFLVHRPEADAYFRRRYR